MIELNPNVTCIHCWHHFPVGEILWQSEHANLIGDLLVSEQPIRFLPSRFNEKGNAIDALGQECHLLACPNCHLTLPRAIVEREVLFVSILGQPKSGKSYYLAALINRMREIFPKHFGVNINDADLKANEILNSYVKELFLKPNADEAFVLGELIPKTQLGGTLYSAVNYGDQTVRYPKPFSFNFDPVGQQRNQDTRQRMLCLYDNAGEHYEAGRDSNRDPGTRHMAMADFLLFVYDPTHDSRWLEALDKDVTNQHFAKETDFQEHILLEAASRIRVQNGLSEGEPIDKPLFVVLCKADVWLSILGDMDSALPLVSDGKRTILDFPRFKRQSDEIQQKLEELIPAIVRAAESVSNQVYFVPVSAIGNRPTEFTSNDEPMMCPADIKPYHVELPVIAGLALADVGLVELGS